MHSNDWDDRIRSKSQGIRDLEARYPTFDSRRQRLRWLCADMIERLESATALSVGSFDVRAHEAGYLAESLGFRDPPVQCLTYSRDGDNSIIPSGNVFPQCEPPAWLFLRHDHPETLYWFGYRVYDPAEGLHIDLHTGAIRESDDPNTPKMVTENIDESAMASNRDEIVQYLRRWVSAIDGLQARPSPVQPAADSPESEIDVLVTLSQVGSLSGIKKRTLDAYLRKGKIPESDRTGKGGKAHKWYYRRLREALQEDATRLMPAEFPIDLFMPQHTLPR